MATLSVQDLSLSGLEVSYANAAGGGDVFANDGKTFLRVVNGAGADITVTITTQDTSVEKPGYGTLTIGNATVTVTAGEARDIGFFPPARFNNASGQVAVGYSSATSVTVAAVRCPRAEV